MAIFDAPLTSYAGGQHSYGVNPAATSTFGGTVTTARSPQFALSPYGVGGIKPLGGVWAGTTGADPTSGKGAYEVFGGPIQNTYAMYNGYSPAGINAAAAHQRNSLAQMQQAINTYASPGQRLQLAGYSNNVNIPNYFNQARGAVAGSQGTIQDLINQYAKNPTIFGADASQQALNEGQLRALQAQGTPNVGGTSSQAISDAFRNARTQFDPYTALGQGSLSQLSALSGLGGQDLQNQSTQALLNSPEVQNQLNMGTSAIGRLASAKGMLRSGNVVRELQDFGQSLALNSLAQKRDSLLAQANLGSNAAQQVAGLYSGEQQAQIGRDDQIRQAQIAQDANMRSAQLQAAGLSAQQANEMANRFVQEQQAQTDESRYDFEANTAVNRANTQDAVRANQDYLNYILGIYNAQGQVNANQQLGLNSLKSLTPI